MFLLHLLISSTVEKSAPVRLQYKCPVCETRDATGEAYDQTEQYKTMLVLPFRAERTTWIRCTKCAGMARSELPVAELARQPPSEIYRYTRRSLPAVLVGLLILGLPAVIIPGICFIFSIPALIESKKYGGWVRTLAITEVGLGVFFTLMMLLVPFLPEPKYEKPTFAPIRQTAPAAPAAEPPKP